MEHLILAGQGLAMLLNAFLIVWIAKFIYYKAMPFDVREELKNGNTAVGVTVTGYFLAIILIICAASAGGSHGLVEDIKSVTLYSAIGVILLFIAKLLNDKIILHKFCIFKELLEDKNAGTGAVVFGSFIASGLIIAGSILGEGGGIITTLAFFAMGQIALILFAKIYNLITKHDIHEEIEKNNIAAGVAVGGAMIAFGLVLFKGVAGDFTGWFVDSMNFLTEILAGFILLPVFRVLFDRVLIPKINLDDEISKGNLAIGFLEAGILIAIAAIYFFVADFSLIQVM